MTNTPEELNKIDVEGNSDLKIVVQEIKDLYDTDDNNDWLEHLSWSLTSGLSEYLKQHNDVAQSLLNVLNNLEDTYASSQEIANLKAFLQPLIQGKWEMPDVDDSIHSVNFRIDSRIQSVLLSKITELKNSVKDADQKNVLDQIYQIVNNPNLRGFNQLSQFLEGNDIRLDSGVVGSISNLSQSVNVEVYSKHVLTGLNTFLEDINTQISAQNSVINATDRERGKEDKAYAELMEYVPWSLRKLNRMSNKDLRRLNAYIQRPNNRDNVLNLYYELKYNSSNWSIWMDEIDWKKGQTILQCIESVYSNDLPKYELDKLFNGVTSSKNDLVDFLKNNFDKEDWDWSDLEGDVLNESNKFKDYNFTADQFINRFNGLNGERIQSNNEKVSWIDVSSLFTEENLKLFTIDWDKVEYNGNEFTADKMMELFRNQIIWLIPEGADFVNEDEKKSCVNDNKDSIFNNVVDYIKENLPPEVEEQPEQQNNDVIDGVLNDFELRSDVDNQINNALDSHGVEWKFYEKDDSAGIIKYNMNVIKDYLNKVKEEPYTGRWIDFKAVTMAFQIVLKYGEFGWKYDDLWKIDWLFYLKNWGWSKTRLAVKDFQKDYWFTWKDLDWKPGPKTITLLLDVLNGGVSGDEPVE